MKKIINTEPKCPLESHHITKSTKAIYVYSVLALATVMQYFGKFDGEFPAFLKFVLGVALTAQASQDWNQIKEKAKLLRKKVFAGKDKDYEETTEDC